MSRTVGPESQRAARISILDRLVSGLVREGLLDGGGLGLRQVNAAGRLELGLDREPAEFLDELLAAGRLDPGLDWATVRAEATASVAGYALALDEAARRAEKWRAGGVDRVRPFTALLARAGDSPLAMFEQLVVDGHPLHFGARIRIGMSAADAVRYGPEFGAEFGLRLVAVRRAAAIGADGRGGADPADPVAGLAAVDQVLAAAFPRAVAAAGAQLRAAGRDPAGYVLLPVHPHQLAHALPRLHAGALADGTVVELAATVPARALMSTRTLLAREPGSPGLHVKTALEVRLTNAVRGVSPESVRNSPLLTVLLARIAERDPVVGRLWVPGELAGACLAVRYENSAGDTDSAVSADQEPGLSTGVARKSASELDNWDDGEGESPCGVVGGAQVQGQPLPDPEPSLPARRRSLGVLLRPDPEAGLPPDQTLLPVAALLARSPLTGHTVLADLLTEYRTDPRDWLLAHLDTLLPSLLTLATRYGIALEPHPQNTVLALRDGLPVRALVRDFGGARVLRSRLEDSGYAVTLEPGSGLYAADAAALRDKLFFPLFGNQLAELVPALATAGGCREDELWPLVAQAAAEVLAGLDSAPAVDDARALLAADWRLKAIVRMRLGGQVTDQAYVAAPNPLGQRLNPLEERFLAELRDRDPGLAVRWLAGLPAARADTAADLGAALRREDREDGEAAVEALPAAFRTELLDSVANRALARALVARRWERSAAADLVTLVRSGADATELESLNAEGHPLHPCRRTRLGFTVGDVLAYAPEAGPTVGVRLAAVDRRLLLESAPAGSVGELLAAGFPWLAEAADRRLRALDRDPAGYALVPVHPWQVERVLPEVYAAELAAGELVLLDGVVLDCRPTASIRTLVTCDPGRDGRRLVLKLALDIQLTGSRRTISPATAWNSPYLARILAGLLAAGPGAAGFVPELAGVCFRPAVTSPTAPATAVDPLRSRGLSALVRADAADQLGPGERLVSGCALLAVSPGGTPLVAELVAGLAARDRVPAAVAVERFLREYAGLLCAATLPLLWRYGLALEAHLQNTLLVVDGAGRPVRVLLRDSGGLRLHPGRWAAAGIDFTPHPGSVTVCPDLDTVRAKLGYTLVRGNLGVLIDRLAGCFGLAAAGLWAVPRQVVERVAADPVARVGTPEDRIAADLAALLGPTLPEKAFTLMRSRPERGDVYVARPNPLFAAGG